MSSGLSLPDTKASFICMGQVYGIFCLCNLYQTLWINGRFHFSAIHLSFLMHLLVN
uniref:Uncharacterized protein LOC105647182 isoform X2 n=1 Tax=Rhizophora mucronata TaxID=61149 RepID=A0A2P2MF73_RHIMU